MDINLLRQANQFFELMKDADKKKVFLQGIIADKEQVAVAFTEAEAVSKEAKEKLAAANALMGKATSVEQNAKDLLQVIASKEAALKDSQQELALSSATLKEKQEKIAAMSKDLEGKEKAFSTKVSKEEAALKALEILKNEALHSKSIYDSKLAALKKTMGE